MLVVLQQDYEEKALYQGLFGTSQEI